MLSPYSSEHGANAGWTLDGPQIRYISFPVWEQPNYHCSSLGNEELEGERPR